MTTETKQKVTCMDCGESFNPDDCSMDNDGMYLCNKCRDNWNICERCENFVHRDDTEHAFHRSYCRICFDELYFYCPRCDNLTSNDDGRWYEESQEYLCPDCYDEMNDNDEQCDRRFSDCLSHCSLPVEQARYFSCEIETRLKNYDSLQEISNDIPREIGITNDGSINGFGKEFITPKLNGDKGLALLKKLCTSLRKHNAFVDRSCGLHIHIDASDFLDSQEDYKTNTLKFYKLRNLFLFYMVIEPVLFSYLPLSRRRNNYCLPLTDFFHIKEVQNSFCTDDLEKMWYREQDQEMRNERKSEKYDNTRYSGINFHSLFSKNNLEVRYHSGTIDYEKIVMWIKLHTAIMDYVSKSGTGDYSSFSDIRFLPSVEDKHKRLFQLLNLSNEIEKYFKDRQNKFSITTNQNENICAE